MARWVSSLGAEGSMRLPRPLGTSEGSGCWVLCGAGVGGTAGRTGQACAVRAVGVRGQGWGVGWSKGPGSVEPFPWQTLPLPSSTHHPPIPPLPRRHRPRPPWPVSGLGSASRTDVPMISQPALTWGAPGAEQGWNAGQGGRGGFCGTRVRGARAPELLRFPWRQHPWFMLCGALWGQLDRWAGCSRTVGWWGARSPPSPSSLGKGA